MSGSIVIIIIQGLVGAGSPSFSIKANSFLNPPRPDKHQSTGHSLKRRFIYSLSKRGLIYLSSVGAGLLILLATADISRKTRPYEPMTTN